MLEYNQVYNMDCLEGMKEIPQGTVNLVIADPPYFLGMTSNGQKGAFSDLNICKPFYIELAKEIERVLRYDGEFYIFMDWRSLAFYFPIFDDFLPVKNLIVWDKIAGPGNFYSYNHEFILYGTKNGTLKKGGSNVWHYKGFSSGAKATDGEKIHPAQKPTELIARIIAESCPRGGCRARSLHGLLHDRRLRTPRRGQVLRLRDRRRPLRDRTETPRRREEPAHAFRR